jgi:hypothetical protein
MEIIYLSSLGKYDEMEKLIMGKGVKNYKKFEELCVVWEFESGKKEGEKI